MSHAGGTSAARGSGSTRPFRLRFDFSLLYVQKDKSLSALLTRGHPSPLRNAVQTGRKGLRVSCSDLPPCHHRCCSSGSSLYPLLLGWVGDGRDPWHQDTSLGVIGVFSASTPFFFFVITFALQVVIVTDMGTACSEDSQAKLCLLQLVLAFCPPQPY